MQNRLRKWVRRQVAEVQTGYFTESGLSQSPEIKAQEQSTSQLLRKRPRKILGLLMTESTAQVVVKKLFLESLLIKADQKSRFAPIVLQQ
ncbi:MAG: hypothetical protein Tsb0017_21480 [Geothermobacteraceae bacterium]